LAPHNGSANRDVVRDEPGSARRGGIERPEFGANRG